MPILKAVTLIEKTPSGIDYHDSFAKHSFNAVIARLMEQPAKILTNLALQSVAPYGYSIIEQEREGYKDEPLKVKHIQSMDRPDLPITCDKEAHTVLLVSKVHRNLAIDSLLEFSNVSTNPYQPGPMAAVGPRPQKTDQVDVIKAMCKPTISDRELCSKWLDIKPQMRPAVWSPASTVSDTYKTGSIEFHRECMKADITYFETACLELDFSVFAAMMFAAGKRVKQVPRLNDGPPPCCGKIKPVTFLLSQQLPGSYSPES